MSQPELSSIQQPMSFSALVGADLIKAVERDAIERRNPANGELVSRYPGATVADVGVAVAAAKDAADKRGWSSVSGAERARFINRVARLIDENRAELGRIESLEGGKPLSVVDGEIQASINLWEYAATLARHVYGDTYDQLGDHTMGLVFREPIDVVAMITPWNFPLLIVSQKLPFALAMGCCAVIKPSEMTSGTTLRLGELLLEAGLPRGVVSIVAGRGPDIGQALCEHPDVEMISFTGSTRVGKHISRLAAEGLKKVSLELGGKSAHIVCEDGDLDLAVGKVVQGAVFNAGQCCVSGSRLLVQRSIAKEFNERVIERMRGIKVGDPSDPSTTMGPLVSDVQHERVTSYIETGKREGASLWQADLGRDGTGYFVPPTVFTSVDPSMKIAQEEIFGPVLSILPFDTVDEAIEIANGTLYGLAAGVWTRDLDKAFRFSRRLRAGTIEVNTYMAGEPELPLVGHRESGLGHEKGRFAVDEFTRLKTVQIAFAGQTT